MQITEKTRILVLVGVTRGAYGCEAAFGCVPRVIGELGSPVQMLDVTDINIDSYSRMVTAFSPDLIFGYLQQPSEVIKVAEFLKLCHPAPAFNWYLEDPNAVVGSRDNTCILDATAAYDFWFSQDLRMQQFWKTRSAFMPPGFDDTVYFDSSLPKDYDISYIGQLGPDLTTRVYWPYMKELARYGRRTMLCIDRPMGIPLLPRPLERFLRSPRRRSFLQRLAVWKCGWENPADEREKARIINMSRIHFGMVRVRGEWEQPLRQLLPDYPLDEHGLFYQLKGRLFQAVGAGAMALNEYCPELEDLFEIDKEIVTFRYGETADVREKLKWYLSHESVRQKVARAGYERGRKCHTFRHRVRQILDMVGHAF